MPILRNTSICANLFRLALIGLTAATWNAFAQTPSPTTVLPVTSLLQMVELLNREERVVRDVSLEATVCSASDPSAGVLVLQDASDTELVQLGAGLPKISSGERIRIESKNCLLRRRELGVQISLSQVVDNDKMHGKRTSFGGLSLRAGRYPLTLEWFNQFQDNFLEVNWQELHAPAQIIPDGVLFHRSTNESSGQAAFLSGLQAESFEGKWERVPDFDLLQPDKSGVVTNFDLGFGTRHELVAMRFRGYLDVPTNSYFTFNTRSADGSLLFIGNPGVPVTTLGPAVTPKPEVAMIGQAVKSPNQQSWVSVEGRVGSVASVGKGLELLLYAGQNSLQVQIADAERCDLAALSNSQVRVTGVGCGILTLGGSLVLGKLAVADIKDLEFLGKISGVPPSSATLQKIRQVQTLPLDKARDGLPVHIRGVVTAVGGPYDFWISIQDDTRGIFVDYHGASNSVPVCGDFYEIIGHSGAGDFAPVVVADQLVRLGKGELPEAAHPAWNALNNGSMDVQWVEFQGLVTDVRSNTLSMLLSDGQMDVQVEGLSVSRLKSFEKSVVHVRGVLFAVWNATREVRVGRILMRNASMAVGIPAPTDPFDAVLKTPRELLLFDAQATAFRRVKVRGQIIHADAKQIFLTEDGAGLRILPAEKTILRPGDLAEAVGYPDIGGPALFLREAHLKKTGMAALPPAKKLAASELMGEGLDSTRVLVEGMLLGWHFEQGVPVLEMQSGAHLFLARLPEREAAQLSWCTGSRLELTGIYLRQERNPRQESGADTFELVLNSAADIKVLSQPTWWTLQRLLIIVGILLAVLIFASAWITQLRRLVEKRTAQLQRETRERERVERQHALEAERSRIARDLHDDLGSSLTEISVLASTGQRPAPGETSHLKLFHAIAGKARSLIAALDVIVWAVDPEDNSLQSLGDYLTGYAEEFFSRTSISCRFKVPVAFPQIILDGRVRHDLLLAVKETLNNIVRHAEATEVEFCMAIAGDDLEVGITDNGKGFEGSGDGHGLKNLSARLLKLGGTCAVESHVGGGTAVKIRLSLVASDETKSGRS